MGDSENAAANADRKFTRDEQNFVVSFIQFLRHKSSVHDCNVDQAEEIETIIHYLELSFGLSNDSFAFQPSKSLFDSFIEAEGSSTNEKELPNSSEVDIEQANKLKEEGNDLVKASKFEEAIEKYNEAIKLNRDPIYFCNRAAAYCRLEQHDLAIKDCRTALSLDPNYAKAYGRMGVALSCQSRYDQAVEVYKRAVELDPNNESYKTNMSIAREKMAASIMSNYGNSSFGGVGGMGGMGGMGGLSALFNSPEMASTAAQMMSDPNVQNMMARMMSSFSGMNGNQAGAGGAGNAGGAPGLDGLMRVGEQIAETLQQSNPQLVEQLRQQFNATRGPSGENGGNNRDNDNAGGNI